MGGLIVVVILGGFAIGNEVGHQAGFDAGYQYGIDAASEEFSEESSEIKQELEESKQRYFQSGYEEGLRKRNDCDWFGVAMELHLGITENRYYREGYRDAEAGRELYYELDCNEIWDAWRNLKAEAENEGMEGITEKTWNCLWCDLVGFAAGYGKEYCPVPQDIEHFCKDWGEGVCYVCDDVAYIGE